MNDLEKKFYARHLAAIQKEKPTDIKHWKYVSKKRGPNGKWQYKYKESDKSNKLTGRTDHEYTMSKTSDDTSLDRTPSYEIVDETTGVKFTYDEDTKECKFEFSTYYEDKNAKYSVEKGEYSGTDGGGFVDKHVYEYTHDGKQYKTTVTVSAKDGTPHKMETRDLTSDTVVEKVIDKVKGLFKKKSDDR